MTERMVASIAADLRIFGIPPRLASEAADKLDELVTLLAAAETDRDRYREHSVCLNTLAYRVAEAVGDAKNGEPARGRPVEQVERLIAERNAGLRVIAETRRDITRVLRERDETTEELVRLTDTVAKLDAERDRLAVAVDQLAPVVDAARAWYANGVDPGDRCLNALVDAVTTFEGDAPDRPTVRMLDGNMQWTGPDPCPECQSPPRQECSDG